MFSIEFVVFVVHSRDVWSCVSVSFSLFHFGLLLLDTSDGQTLFIRVYRSEHRRLLRAQCVESSVGITFVEQENGILASSLMEIDMSMIALSCHFALDLLCYNEGVYGVCMMLHRGTIVHGVCLRCGTIAILATS